MLNGDFTDFIYLRATDVAPPRVPAASIYGFDDISPADLAHHMAQAQLEADALRRQRGIVGPVPPPAVPVPPAPF